MAAPAFQCKAEGLAYQSLAQYEQVLRARAEHALRSVEEYVGLSVEQASDLAAYNGDELCVHKQARQGHRANWQSNRVHVATPSSVGVIRAAKLDPEPWVTRDRPGSGRPGGRDRCR